MNGCAGVLESLMCGSGAQRWLQWFLIIEEGVAVDGNCLFSDSVSSPKLREKCVLQTLLSSARPRLERIWPCKQGVEVCPDHLW